jgi:ribonucleotide monophosphatase NagD (HAD superfamily)
MTSLHKPASPVCAEAAVMPLLAGYDAALLDLDGVVYSGQDAIAGAVPALAAARAAGLRLAFVTNNASRSAGAIAAQLARRPAMSADVVTSARPPRA